MIKHGQYCYCHRLKITLFACYKQHRLKLQQKHLGLEICKTRDTIIYRLKTLLADYITVSEHRDLYECYLVHKTPSQITATIICFLVASISAADTVVFRDTTTWTVVNAATLRQKLPNKLDISPSHSLKTSDQPAVTLMLCTSQGIWPGTHY